MKKKIKTKNPGLQLKKKRSKPAKEIERPQLIAGVHYLRSHEVRALMGICPKTLFNYEQQGTITPIKLSKKSRFKYYDEREIQHLFSNNKN